MIYFVISDIHSFYDEMIDSLHKAGYEKDNSKHHLLVLGDLFDRGPKSKEVLNFLYPFTQEEKCTIILGNHDVFLLEILEGNFKKVNFNIEHNGHGETLEQLSGIKPTLDNHDLIKMKIEERYPHLYNWINSFPLFLEIKDYIFVHGGIDGEKPNWRTETSVRDFVWNKEYLLPRVENKTVVCGHTRVATIKQETNDYKKLYITNPDSFNILRLDGKIMIDRFVEVSHEINVLKLEI